MIRRTIIFGLYFIIFRVKSQENAASSVAKSLMECYNGTENLDRESRPPSSINVLIALINKIESGPSIQNDREFSKEIIHRFKQDGIVKYSTSGNSPYSVPYTPQGMQSSKHKLLLRKLVPGNAINFPNETLNEIERCSMHFMLSNTIQVMQRGDEATVCNKLDRFQRRIRRDVNPNSDVEIFNPSKLTLSKGNLQGDIPDEQVEKDVHEEPRDVARTTVTIVLSDCPIEDGAVYTRWGTIQPGLVMAGIAAGREPQNVPTEEQHVIDNRYGATLAGDLAEVGLHQGAGSKVPMTVGAKGGWNGTQVPRWYFIEKNADTEMTDAEIRGGLDGLIIAKNIEKWHSKASSLKISQILDMYYSPRGVFSKKYRACNRRQLFTEVAPQEELIAQTIAFSFLLDGEAELPGSIYPEGIKEYGKQAVASLINYLPNLQDLSCENTEILRTYTDILIVLDLQWEYKIIYNALAYLLDNLDINKYDSSFTIINGQDGGIIVNSSNTILDYYAQYNRTAHLQHPQGFDVPRIFNVIEMMMKRKIDDATVNRKAGGQSTVILFVPYNTINDNDKIWLNEKKQYFKTSVPDMKLLVVGRNSKEAYADLVLDQTSDSFALSGTSTDGTSITDSINPVISRVKQIHRRIVNPNCGSNWSGEFSSDSLDQYIEPNTINYYRIAPNYIYGEATRALKIRRSGYGNIVACTSRQNEKPRKNATEGSDIKCETISSNEVTFDLTNACTNYDEFQQCLPVYVSVEETGTGEESTYFACTDQGCRFPDNTKYTIQLENFGCYSGSYRISSNVFILFTMPFIVIRMLF